MCVCAHALKGNTNSENCHSILSMELSAKGMNVRQTFLWALFNKLHSEASCY